MQLFKIVSTQLRPLRQVAQTKFIGTVKTHLYNDNVSTLSPVTNWHSRVADHYYTMLVKEWNRDSKPVQYNSSLDNYYFEKLE